MPVEEEDPIETASEFRNVSRLSASVDHENIPRKAKENDTFIAFVDFGKAFGLVQYLLHNSKMDSR